MTKEFVLPVEIEKQLTDIFTSEYMQGVKSACRRYIYEASEKKPGFADDGRTLIEIADKAYELRQLLKKSNAALKRVHLHLSKEIKKHNVLFEINDIKENLKFLEDICRVNPASERAKTPQRGKPAGSANEAKQHLAFHLWEIYRQGHGKPAGRANVVVDVDDDRGSILKEGGPLPRAVDILRPILGIKKGNLARYFREINKRTKNKKKK